MTYKVQKRGKEFALIENVSTVINVYDNEKEANDICRGLNLGKGFDGHVPSFFTVKLISNKTENETYP